MQPSFCNEFKEWCEMSFFNESKEWHNMSFFNKSKDWCRTIFFTNMLVFLQWTQGMMQMFFLMNQRKMKESLLNESKECCSSWIWGNCRSYVHKNNHLSKHHKCSSKFLSVSPISGLQGISTSKITTSKVDFKYFKWKL